MTVARTLIDKYGTIADMIIENPLMSRRDVADALGISYATVCLIVRSDAFEAILHEKKTVVNALVMDKLESRIESVTVQALEQLSESMEGCADKEFLLRAASTLLDRHPSSRPAQSNDGNQAVVQISIGQDVWEQSQNRMIERKHEVIPAPSKALEVFDAEHVEGAD